jgi:hypothetical protein
MPASTNSVKSLLEDKLERCASCGKVKGLSLFPPNSTDDAYLFCAECLRRLGEGERLYLLFTSEYESPSPPEEGFWRLFKAARVLMREGISDEDQILPTLVFAHEIDRGAARGRAATTYENTGLMPHEWNTVKTVDGIGILEEVPIRADILVKHPPPDKEAERVPQGVLIQVSFHKKAVEPRDVGSIYAERLTAKGMRFGSAPSGSIDYEFVGNRLYLTIKLKKELPVGGSIFPSPQLVDAFYRGLKKGFGKRLTTHGKQFVIGNHLGVSNLIPASVAFLLRASGGIKSQKEIHRLLNDQVFGEQKFHEDGYASTSEVVQLRENVPKAGERIARMLPLVWGRPFPEPF